MKRNLLLLFILIPLITLAQSKEIKEKLNLYERENYYTIDGNNIVVSTVIEDIPGTKDEIFLKTKSYFARAYKNANSVIQTEDKEAGLIIGKGLYDEFYGYTANLIIPVRYSAYHVMRVDIKAGRVRVICSANKWIAEWSTPGNNYKKEEYLITNRFPFTDKSIYSNKGKTAEAFIALIDMMYLTIDNLEKSLTEGGVVGENDDW